MKKLLVLIYGFINYNLGSLALVSIIAFMFNLIPDNPFIGNIDAAETSNPAVALLVNLGLIALFGFQHSVMARPRFKKWLTRYIPQAAERSTYMVATAVAVFALILGWQPMTGTVWNADNDIAYSILMAIGLSGWTLVLYSTFQINHFDLFGLRQVWLYFRGKEYTQLPFQVTGLYRYMRHPIMTGAFIGIWATPVMTTGHLLFAVGMSAYILIGVYHEEKDLVRAFGDRYRGYMQSTAKFFPVWARKAGLVRG
jgi:protein-S-isoprenylcysteine O-methyltransferase Ste14